MKYVHAVRSLMLAGVVLAAAEVLAQDGKAPVKQIQDIKELLTDTAAGHISAAGMLGINGSAVQAVENTRTLLAAVQGLGTKGSQVAFAFAPARSSLIPMSLSTYASGSGYRLLGNTTLAYAQGTAKVADVEMERRAISIETSITINDRDDPLIAVYDSCKWEAPIARPDVAEVDFTAANKAYTECIAKKEAELAKKWNISRFSLSIGTGTVRPDGFGSNRLGTTLAASLVYGFDHFGPTILKEGAALAVTYRRISNEPVLKELAKGNLVRKSSNLIAARISGGSSTVRFLGEVSNARDSDVTSSQMVYKQALGVDVRVAEGSWVTLRSGKQRKVSGDGSENVTLLNFSFSPKSDLL